MKGLTLTKILNLKTKIIYINNLKLRRRKWYITKFKENNLKLLVKKITSRSRLKHERYVLFIVILKVPFISIKESNFPFQRSKYCEKL